MALKQWVELNGASLTSVTAGHVDQLEKVGRLMMTIGSRLEAGDSAENDQVAIKRRVEAVWKLRRVTDQSSSTALATDFCHFISQYSNIFVSGQSKGECRDTAFPRLLFPDCIVPLPGFKS